MATAKQAAQASVSPNTHEGVPIEDSASQSCHEEGSHKAGHREEVSREGGTGAAIG